jgi:hypothetical protein
VGDTAHVLLYRGTASQLVSVQYVPASNTYALWSVRSSTVNITLDSGVEVGTIDVDSQGRMWLASDAATTVNVRWADRPYSTWSAPIQLASGITADDISSVIAFPTGKVGVFWSNQTTARYGFRVHTDGASPTTWAADEVPASQSAFTCANALGMADDHLHLTAASNGTVYAAGEDRMRSRHRRGGHPVAREAPRRDVGQRVHRGHRRHAARPCSERDAQPGECHLHAVELG